MTQNARHDNPANSGAVLAGMKDVVRGSLVVPDLASYGVAAEQLAGRAVEVVSSLLTPRKSRHQG